MKNIILLFVLPFLVSPVFSQDTLLTRKGEKIIAIVSSITSTDIEFKKFDNQTGPQYTRSKAEIKSISYKNGTIDVFELPVVKVESDDYYGGNQVKNEAGSTSASSMSKHDIASASQLVFYGIDFSNLNLVEGKRKNEASKIKDVHFSEWNQFFIKEVPTGTMERWLKKAVIIYTTDVVTKINAQTDPEKIVIDFLDIRDMMPLISNSISNYAAIDSKTTGIGFVICLDYFNKARTETCANFTFFDIATHTVICTEQIRVREVKGAGLTNFWGSSLVAAMKDFVDYRYKGY